MNTKLTDCTTREDGIIRQTIILLQDLEAIEGSGADRNGLRFVSGYLLKVGDQIVYAREHLVEKRSVALLEVHDGLTKCL